MLGTRATEAEAAAVTQLPVFWPGYRWWTRGLARASVAVSSGVAAIAFLQQLLISAGLCLTRAHYFIALGKGGNREPKDSDTGLIDGMEGEATGERSGAVTCPSLEGEGSAVSRCLWSCEPATGERP